MLAHLRNWRHLEPSICENWPMLRWLTAGESHGPALSAIIEGVPAHVQISSHDIDFHLARRRLGVGRGARQNFEADQISILEIGRAHV